MLIRDDGVVSISSDSSISRYGSDIIGGYIEGKCPDCGKPSLMYGPFEKVAVERGRGMGKEIFYDIRHYAQCTGCGRDMFIRSEFSEYPIGNIRYLQTAEIDAESTDIGNLSAFVSDIESKITTIDDVFGSMQELEAALEETEDSLPPVMAAMQELRQSENTSALVLGNYDEIEVLRGVKGDIGEMGYSAYLAEDIRERLEDDPDQAVKLLMHMCSFAVAVDSEASGHISEIEWATNDRQILAVLVPEQRGRASTAMISRSIEEQPNTEVFEYTDEPSECLEDVFEWALERIGEKRESNKRFPWK